MPLIDVAPEADIIAALEALGWLGWVILSATPAELERIDLERLAPEALAVVLKVLRVQAKARMDVDAGATTSPAIDWPARLMEIADELDADRSAEFENGYIIRDAVADIERKAIACGVGCPHPEPAPFVPPDDGEITFAMGAPTEVVN